MTFSEYVRERRERKFPPFSLLPKYTMQDTPTQPALTAEIAAAALQFLERVELRGAEVRAYNIVTMALTMIAKPPNPQEQEEG